MTFLVKLTCRCRYLPLIVLIAVSLLIEGCGGGLLNPSPPAQSTPAGNNSAGTYSPTVGAPLDVVGVCIDPTLSTVPGFSRGALGLVRGIVGGWSVVPPSSVSEGTPPQPGLSLEIRQVSTNSYSTMNPYTMVQIVGVPGLKPRPDATSDGFLTQDAVWQRAAATVAARAAKARRQAATGAARLGAISLEDKPNNYSEILGCVTSLGQTMPAGSHRSIVLFSDLEQNRPPQAGRYLTDTSVLVVQACDSGNATACGSLQPKWRDWLRAQGATSVQFIRPEQAASVVPAFVKEVATS